MRSEAVQAKETLAAIERCLERITALDAMIHGSRLIMPCFV